MSSPSRPAKANAKLHRKLGRASPSILAMVGSDVCGPAVLPDGADVVYDSIGRTLGDSLSLARTGGTVVFYGMAAGDPDPVDPRLLMDRSLTLVGGDL